MKYYTGIGSRETPIEIMDFMSELAGLLSELGYTVRSGGADGADTAFYDGVEDKAHPCELWLPWKGFNGNHVGLYPNDKHFQIASLIHPVWAKLPPAVRKLHARNVGQVLGDDFDVDDVTKAILLPHTIHYPKLPQGSLFTVCWTKDGADAFDLVTSKTGGTGTAIKLSDYVQVPVFNLANNEAAGELWELVNKQPMK